MVILTLLGYRAERSVQSDTRLLVLHKSRSPRTTQSTRRGSVSSKDSSARKKIRNMRMTKQEILELIAYLAELAASHDDGEKFSVDKFVAKDGKRIDVISWD